MLKKTVWLGLLFVTGVSVPVVVLRFVGHFAVKFAIVELTKNSMSAQGECGTIY